MSDPTFPTLIASNGASHVINAAGPILGTSIDGGFLSSGPNSTNLTFAIPASAATGNTIARFRVSSAGGLSPVGQAPNGEVEDYQITIDKIDSIGVYRAGVFLQDITNDGAWNGVIGGDGIFNFGAVGDIPTPGDWNADGITDLGVYRPSNATFYKDKNDNRVFDAADEIVPFGAFDDLPVVGKFNGDAIDDIGVYRPATATFYLDKNGNGTWNDVAGGDIVIVFGTFGDIPIVGNWNLDTLDEVGVYRPSNATFFRDANGNTTFDGFGGGDEIIPFGAIGDKPIIGNWSGSSKNKIGVFRPSTASFYQDSNGNGLFDAGDKIYQFGAATDLPAIGDWASPAPIMAAAGLAVGPIDTRQLTARELDEVVKAAINGWSSQAGPNSPSSAFSNSRARNGFSAATRDSPSNAANSARSSAVNRTTYFSTAGNFPPPDFPPREAATTGPGDRRRGRHSRPRFDVVDVAPAMHKPSIYNTTATQMGRGKVCPPAPLD